MMKILNYIKNTLYFFRKGGFKNGGVVYIRPVFTKEEEIFSEKNVVVTGGSSGIGYAIAKKLVSSGARVLITGRDEEKLKKAVGELGENCIYLRHDMSDIKGMENGFQEMLRLLGGRVDGLVNNAGTGSRLEYPNIDEEEWDRLMGVHLKGPYFLSQLAYKQMLSQGGGSIVMTLSNAVLAGGVKPYEIMKTGLRCFVEGLAKVGAVAGIRCNAVAPGYTISSIHKEFEKDAIGNLAKEGVRDGRWHLAEEVAEVVGFLLSDRSICLNGQIVACDSGDKVR